MAEHASDAGTVRDASDHRGRCFAFCLALFAASLIATSRDEAGAQAIKAPASAPVPAFVDWRAVGDSIPEPLAGLAGDPSRGERIVADRRESLCLLCHQGPLGDARMQGTVAPPLQGAGSRWTEGQLRLRIVDARVLNPESIMPTYHRRDDREHRQRVGTAWVGKPILDAQQIEDVVAWLLTQQ